MKHRPWPIVILALCQIFVEPFSNILLGSWLSRMSPFDFVSDFAHRHDWLPLVFTILLPMAMGASVWMMKRWSYPAYLAGALWGLAGNIQTWRVDPHAFPIYLFLPLFILNVGVVSYFLLPVVRAGFMDSRLRWWESHPRYQVDLSAMIRAGEKIHAARITNLSLGGVFANIPGSADEIAVGAEVEIYFRFLNQKLKLPATLVHSRGKAGYGLQFTGLAPDKKRLVRLIARTLNDFGYPGRPARYLTPGNFWAWAIRVVKEKRGLVPEIRLEAPKKTPQEAPKENGTKIA